MGSTVVEVIKVVAPFALEALAKAAIQLVSAEAPALVVPLGDGPDGWAKTMDQDTEAYNVNQFATNFGYYYEGTNSVPAHGGTVKDGTDDIIVWDPSKNENTDITSYLTDVFRGSIPPGDSIFLTNNIASLFKIRFGEIDLGWSPFSKQYNLPSGLVVDAQMVTAGGVSKENKPVGVARYCFVAYEPPK